MAFLFRGKMMGELDILQKEPNYTTSVKCLFAGELLKIHKDDFLKLQ